MANHASAKKRIRRNARMEIANKIRKKIELDLLLKRLNWP